MTWEGESLLRAGRLATLEIVLDDSSVSRRHAEIKHTPNGWRIRDLGSTNGTFLNGARLGNGEQVLRQHDIVRCGNVTLVVEILRHGRDDEPPPVSDNLLVEASASHRIAHAPP